MKKNISDRINRVLPSSMGLFVLATFLCSCEMIHSAKKEIKMIRHHHNTHKTAIWLAKENREMKLKIRNLNFKIQKLQSQNNYLNNYLKIKLKKIGRLEKKTGRKVASLTAAPTDKNLTYVKLGAYRWAPNQALTIASRAYEKKDYVKAFQYFHAFISQLPNHKRINDNLLFRTGMAAFESKRYKDGIAYFDRLIQKFPKSQAYRNAKLWRSIAALKLGRKKEFLATVEEFRKKYRNTNEWKILAQHYENIIERYNAY